MPQKTLITAHSGADGTPENSMEFVRYALTTGADALEVDVRRLPDGTLALGHDETGAHAPRLEEVFALLAAQPEMKINCDLKERGLEEDAYRLAVRHGLAGRVIYSGSVDAAALRRIGGLSEAVEIYLNIEEYVPDMYLNYREVPDFELRAAETICAVCRENGIRTVNMNQMLITRRFLERLSENDLGVSAWTVNSPREIGWFLSRGVTNITTRRPASALALRG